MSEAVLQRITAAALHISASIKRDSADKLLFLASLIFRKKYTLFINAYVKLISKPSPIITEISVIQDESRQFLNGAESRPHVTSPTRRAFLTILEKDA